MTKIIVAATLAVTLASCSVPETSTEKASEALTIEVIGTYQGCDIIRWFDYYRWEAIVCGDRTKTTAHTGGKANYPYSVTVQGIKKP